MMILGRFSKYVPVDNGRTEDAEFINKLTGQGVIFLKDEAGVDWYDAQKQFSHDTMKVVFDDDGIIRFFSTDASMLNPVNMFVGELELSDVPEELNVFGEWVFDGGAVFRREYTKDELITHAEERKKALLETATLAIAPLQDAVDMNLSTEEENQLLIELKKFRVLVNRIDTSLVPDIDWPSAPQSLHRT